MDRIQFRRDTLDRWNSVNPILLEGEIGYVLDDPNLYKMGDGIHTWDQLLFRGFNGTIVHEIGDNENAVMSQKATSEKLAELERKTDYFAMLAEGIESIDFIKGSLYTQDLSIIKNSDYSCVKTFVKKGETYHIECGNANKDLFPILIFVNSNNEKTLTFASDYSQQNIVYVPVDNGTLYVNSQSSEYTTSMSLSNKIIDREKKTISKILNIYGTSLNLYNDLDVEDGYINEHGEIVGGYDGYKVTKSAVRIKPNTEYKASPNIAVTVCVFDIDFNVVQYKVIPIKASDRNFTTNKDATFVKFAVYNYNDLNHVMIAESSLYPDEDIKGAYPTVNKTWWGADLATTKWKGKKYATLGDSITYRDHYQTIIDKILGTTHINLGISGQMVGYYPFHQNEQGVRDRLLNADDFKGCEVIIVCSYANSLWAKKGSLTDSFIKVREEEISKYSSLSAYMTEVGNQTIFGQMMSVIDFITNLCPDKQVIVVGNIPISCDQDSWNTGDKTVDFHKRYNGWDGPRCTAREISDACKEVANWYGIPYVDNDRNGQVNINNYTNYYDVPDTTHPNYKAFDGREFPLSGMKIMAMSIIEAMARVL